MARASTVGDISELKKPPVSRLSGLPIAVLTHWRPKTQEQDEILRNHPDGNDSLACTIGEHAVMKIIHGSVLTTPL